MIPAKAELEARLLRALHENVTLRGELRDQRLKARRGKEEMWKIARQYRADRPARAKQRDDYRS